MVDSVDTVCLTVSVRVRGAGTALLDVGALSVSF